MARKGKRKSSGYKSKAQVRWAFATKQPFARRWAREAKRKAGKKTWFRKLPRRKGAPKRGKA
jgi:hypothetical protein